MLIEFSTQIPYIPFPTYRENHQDILNDQTHLEHIKVTEEKEDTKKNPSQQIIL